MISLFRLSTIDNVSGVMYTNMWGCDLGGLTDVYGQYPQLCTSPKAHVVSGLIYFVVFIFFAAQIILVLFIGVISTSIEEAQSQKTAELQRQKDIDRFADMQGLSKAQIRAFQEVFNMLDVDKSGVIIEEEIHIVLTAIGMHLSDHEIEEILNIVDKDYEGLDLFKFMHFMYRTPKYAEGAAAVSVVRRMKRKQEKSMEVSWKKRLWRKVLLCFPFFDLEDIELQQEAAVMIQDFWRCKRAKRLAAAVLEEKRKESSQIKSGRNSLHRRPVRRRVNGCQY